MKFLKLFGLSVAFYLIMLAFYGCTTPAGTTAYQTIAASESAVLAANGAYLDAVVTGLASTNDVPKVEAAFNDTQLALHSAAAIASGGSSAPIPLAANVKVMAFTNLVNSVKSK